MNKVWAGSQGSLGSSKYHKPQKVHVFKVTVYSLFTVLPFRDAIVLLLLSASKCAHTDVSASKDFPGAMPTRDGRSRPGPPRSRSGVPYVGTSVHYPTPTQTSIACLRPIRACACTILPAIHHTGHDR